VVGWVVGNYQIEFFGTRKGGMSQSTLEPTLLVGTLEVITSYLDGKKE